MACDSSAGVCMQCSSPGRQPTRLAVVTTTCCVHLLCRFEEYVPRKKRREEEEAKLLWLQGVSVPA